MLPRAEFQSAAVLREQSGDDSTNREGAVVRFTDHSPRRNGQAQFISRLALHHCPAPSRTRGEGEAVGRGEGSYSLK